jgi:hypothetical protein
MNILFPSKVVSQFQHIIIHSNVFLILEDDETFSYKFKGDFVLSTNIRFVVRDYYFPGGRRKYSYHLQDSNTNLIFRYDNEPHWASLPTFPHHKHLPDSVIESAEMTLEMVFAEIKQLLNAQM